MFLDPVAYFKTPLRPFSMNQITSLVHVNEELQALTSTAAGDSSTNPSVLSELTDHQAERGVQAFVRSSKGSLNARFAVASATPGCTGRNLLFSGDSQLCAPPPSPPPTPPPSPPP